MRGLGFRELACLFAVKVASLRRVLRVDAGYTSLEGHHPSRPTD